MDKGKKAETLHNLSESDSESNSSESSNREKSENMEEADLKRPRKKQKKSTSVVSKAKGRLKAEAWKHFIRHTDDNGKVTTGECMYCHKVYQVDSIKNGTGAMNKHMKRCELHPDRDQDQSKLFVKTDKDGATSLKNWSFKPGEVRKAIVRMIIIDELPFSFVEKEGFKGSMEAIRPNYKIPSRTTIARYCDDLFAQEKGTLKSILSNSDVRVSLTTDTWTSIQRINYMCVTAHFIDDKWNLHKRIISFKPISSHTGEDIGRCIHDVIRKWDIKTVMSITIDNASANDAAIDYLKDTLLNNLESNGKYLHMRYTAHILNLIVKDGLKKYEGPVDKIRSGVKYIRNSPSRLERLKSCVAEKKLQSKTGLHLDCPTRWSSTHDMLETASLLSTTFDEYELKDRNYKPDLGEKVPKRVDWKIIKKLISLFQLFKRKTEKVSGTSYVTTNYFLSEVVDLNGKLLRLKNDDDHEYNVMGEAMRDKFNKYWGNIKKLNLAMYFATILDPRMKMEIVEFGFKQIYNMERRPGTDPNDVTKQIKDTIKVVRDEFDTLFFEYVSMYEIPMSTEQYHCEPNVEKYIGDDLIEFHREFMLDGGTSVSETKTELQKYLIEPREPGLDSNEFDILNWWKINSLSFPILAHMAKDILAIPISMVASGSAFSMSGRVLDSFRSSLPTKHVEALVCTQDWIRKSRKFINMDIDFAILDEYDAIAKDISDQAQEL